MSATICATCRRMLHNEDSWRSVCEKCFPQCADRLTDLEQAAHLWRVARELLVEAGCPIVLGCHVPTTIQNWLEKSVIDGRAKE